MTKPPSRWAAVPRFPLTKTIRKAFPLAATKRGIRKPEIVSEQLCDDILTRISPYLFRNRPLDILDLWPGAGLWSSKVNDLLRPRRHVLIEPHQGYRPLLEPLAQSRPGYDLQFMDISAIHDWPSLMSKHLPEQSASNRDDSGALARNDTLLVLANPPPSATKNNHYTPARWWTAFMESCLRQTGIHTYGSVRLLMTLPLLDVQAILPHNITDRKRPAIMAEDVAQHAFAVASSKDTTNYWTTYKWWDQLVDNAARVARKTAEANIVTPEGREYPPLTLAPESPDPGTKPAPYMPRANTAGHDRIMELIMLEPSFADPSGPHKRARNGRILRTNQEATRAWIMLNEDNRHTFMRRQLLELLEKIAELNKALSRAAADPSADPSTLRSTQEEIATLQATYVKQSSETHYKALKQFPGLCDDWRASSPGGNPDNAVLLWERRPFEPLLIQPDELFPRESDRTMVYFEADPNACAARKLHELPPGDRDAPLECSEALTLTLGSRNHMTVPELLDVILPGRPVNDIVRAVPSLAMFANRTLKPDFDTLPKTVHGSPSDIAAGKELDPALCFQENLDYDLSDVRVRTLSTETLWDLFVEYQKSDRKLSPVQLNRLLGGTLTSFKSGEYRESPTKFH
ncbi:uncharacterized protein BDW47DRAFT_109325 [Aspergillus candidus]|uniref:S-adenosyl-L-methionine-dependent methyltransferase n=1 Tax=Aspergillus candidus TaxID=41067 RepID=A0A2I2F5V2_ASPCN|nr:S-adenosyl-L-methionine-dependent methyltransferase [Aspergillus candidus]PLB36017.1 S-adenosyl-L-methionine-dependent methyltransferase [Aspergillus candidus]